MESQSYEDMTSCGFERTKLKMKTDMLNMVISEHEGIWAGAEVEGEESPL